MNVRPKKVSISYDGTAFAATVAAIWKGARANGRDYLDWDEWERFAKAALASGIIAREALAVDDLDELIALQARLTRRVPPVAEMLPILSRAALDSCLRVKIAKRQNLSPQAFAHAWRAELDGEESARKRKDERDHEDRMASDQAAFEADRRKKRGRSAVNFGDNS